MVPHHAPEPDSRAAPTRIISPQPSTAVLFREFVTARADGSHPKLLDRLGRVDLGIILEGRYSEYAPNIQKFPQGLYRPGTKRFRSEGSLSMRSRFRNRQRCTEPASHPRNAGARPGVQCR